MNESVRAIIRHIRCIKCGKLFLREEMVIRCHRRKEGYACRACGVDLDKPAWWPRIKVEQR